MKVFVYEFITGGGLKEQPSGSLLTEGLAMAKALVEDFTRIPNVSVVSTLDERLDARNHFSKIDGLEFESVNYTTHLPTFNRLCFESDCTLVVAPEFSGILSRMTRLATESGTQLLSPNLETVSLFSNKQKTAEWLNSNGISTTSGYQISPRANGLLPNHTSESPAIELPEKMRFPVVVKPVDGAGSIGVCKATNARELHDLTASNCESYRVESFVPGIPASVSILCNNTRPFILPCCQQLFRDGTFEYQGGRLLPEGDFADRATRLAQQVANKISNPHGYLGVDIILGENPSGLDDRVIEINPRITTSYVGLRVATDGNLAEVILRPSDNVDLRFPRRRLEFRSGGAVFDANNTNLDFQRSETLCDG